MDILEFKNEHFFLSNFYETPIFYKGHYFQNNEAAFQAIEMTTKYTEQSQEANNENISKLPSPCDVHKCKNF